MLSDTKLAVVLSTDDLMQLKLFGQTITYQPGEFVFEAGQEAEHLYVIVEGDIYLTNHEQEEAYVAWLGPGDIVGEVGFIFGTKRTIGARAGKRGCTLWHIAACNPLNKPRTRHLAVYTKLFMGLAPYVRVRLTKLQESLNRPADLLENHCDHEHATVRQMAKFLQRETEWDTIFAIWNFVRHIPYRIGFWQCKASRTLELGFGMCTTKSNLQVALMRACGLEARHSEIICPSSSMLPLIPEGYHHLILRKDHIKHYLAVVKMNNRWYPVDATYPPEVWQLFIEKTSRTNPEAASRIRLMLQRGEPYNPFHDFLGRDPFDVPLLDSLAHVMNKRPFYDADNIEAMNIVLDKTQGAFLPVPEWVLPVKRLMMYDPMAAFQRAYAGITSEIHQLYQAIQKTLLKDKAEPAKCLAVL